jgi:hypothetical protein
MLRSIYSDDVRIYFSLSKGCCGYFTLANPARSIVIGVNNGGSTRSHIPFIAL